MLFKIHPPPESPIPIYEQIVTQVIFAVASGSLEVGELIDSVRQLAQRLLVHPNTVAKGFGGKVVVHRLDLAVPKGAIYALLGDNGAGKSTTIRMLTGLLQPDAGRARILGEDCWSKAIGLRHRVGYVPEKPRFYDWMTVGELGDFAAAFHRAGYRDRYRSLIEKYRLGRSTKLKTLSKGGYARVGLALALACDP